MTPSLPAISGKDAIKAFLRNVWPEKSRKGSRVKLVKSGHPNPIIIPVHSNKPLDRGTLASIIKQAGLTAPEFIDIL